jgi:ubiquinone/menaquinone biosynthesis C-methylase UbiE
MRSMIHSVFGRVLPGFAKQAINGHIRTIVNAEGPYLRSHPRENAYCVTGNHPEVEELPVPPRELWVGYGDDAASYLASGEKSVATMVQILEESGSGLSDDERILELGCAAGRMLRHLPKFAPAAELWGVDINAEYIQWCVDHLTPAMPNMQFATVSTIPHLPFEDRYFDFVFCGSVFTHIEDTQRTWLLELARVLRPSGKLFVTIHDEHTVRLLDTTCRDCRLAEIAREQAVYTSNKSDFNMIVIGRGAESQVFYSSRYFKSILPPCLRWVSHTSEAYFYQSAVLVEKPRIS